MESKKPTNAQLLKRIKNATLHLDKTKDTISIFFSDKGLCLTVDENEGYAIIETGYHRHVFNSFTGSGISRPYLYTKRFIEIAQENDCKTQDGYSFARLFDVLKEKEDKKEYNIATYFNWYLYNIFQPLYSIGESEIDSFMVYEDYVHNIARQSILLSEATEDVTNKQFIDKMCENIKKFTDNMDENILLPKKTDQQVMEENISAIQEQMQQDAMEAQINGSQD